MLLPNGRPLILQANFVTGLGSDEMYHVELLVRLVAGQWKQLPRRLEFQSL